MNLFAKPCFYMPIILMSLFFIVSCSLLELPEDSTSIASLTCPEDGSITGTITPPDTSVTLSTTQQTQIIGQTLGTHADGTTITRNIIYTPPLDTEFMTTRTITATTTDDDGSSHMCTFNIEITNNQDTMTSPPEIFLTCPPNIMMTTDSSGNTPPVSWSAPTVVDQSGMTLAATFTTVEVEPPLTALSMPADGSATDIIFPQGTHRVTYTAVHPSQDTITGSCTFIVAGNPPSFTLTCPEDISITTNALPGLVSWEAPIGRDENSNVIAVSFITVMITTTLNPPHNLGDGSANNIAFPEGTFTVTYNANRQDMLALLDSCSFTVTVAVSTP